MNWLMYVELIKIAVDKLQNGFIVLIPYKYMQSEHCLHFSSFKCTKSLFISTHPECKICSFGKNNLWLCLTRDCQQFYCGRRDWQHLLAHYQESRRKKSYHCLFINVLTAEIYCVSCKCFVRDEQNQQQQASHKDKNQRLYQSTPKQHSAIKLRSKVLPFLSELGKFQFDGQIEYPEAHRRINSGSVGIVSDRYNHTIHSAIKFIAHCSYFKQIILAMNLETNNELLTEMQNVIGQINNAKYRVITADKLNKLVYTQKPHLLTYKRKDPFELVLFFLAKLHEQLRYRVLVQQYDEQDEWDVYYERGRTKVSCPIYDSIEIQLRLNYYCVKCKKQQYSVQNINYLKLTINKKKRSNQEVEKELNEFRGLSAKKERRKSLANILFKEPQIPITVHQMIIDLMKKPLHKDKLCDNCHQSMKKQKIQIQKLPDYMLIHINRMDNEGYAIDQTQVDFSHDIIDMGAFTIDKQKQVFYAFECVVGVEKGGLYPIMTRNSHNKQLQLFRNHKIQHSQNINPYILCYKRQKKQHQFSMPKANSEIGTSFNYSYVIPDFWIIQQKNGFQRFLKNPFVCKHNCLKPNLTSLQANKIAVSREIYQKWAQYYTAQVYENYTCFECQENLRRVEERRKEEKQAIKQYDSLKISSYCMVSIDWVNRWSNFVYRKDKPNYLCKGWPMPGKIDNKTIMEGKQCKPYLIQNKDFKLVNIYVWKFLRELYGGGPQIRYKWKKQDQLHLNQKLMQEIKQKAIMMRNMVRQFTVQSPSKKSSTMEESSYMAEQQLPNTYN